MLVAFGLDRVVRIYHYKIGTLLRTIELSQRDFAIASVSLSEHYYAILSIESLALYEVKTNRCVRSLNSDIFNCYDCIVRLDNKLLAVGGNNSYVVIMNWRRRRIVRKLICHPIKRVNTLLRLDRRHLAAGVIEIGLYIWNFHTGYTLFFN